MINKICFRLLIGTLICTPALAQIEAPTGKKWEKINTMSDEFNGKSLDIKKWTSNPEGHPDFGWIGRPPALFKESAVTVKKGFMNIEVGKLPDSFVSNKYAKPTTYDYYGGIIRATQPISYGNYFESRFKMSKTEMGGGFWLMSKSTCDKKHEIDITESIGVVSPLAEEWGKKWDKIMHSNTIHRETQCNK
ncbi:MAG: hypothetical protein WBQ70_12940, partial [Flavobacterium sp.]